MDVTKFGRECDCFCCELMTNAIRVFTALCLMLLQRVQGQSTTDSKAYLSQHKLAHLLLLTKHSSMLINRPMSK